ncbi:MAG: efflux RND transporter periplasmic adaptor subunit [Pirellulales bacterium]
MNAPSRINWLAWMSLGVLFFTGCMPESKAPAAGPPPVPKAEVDVCLPVFAEVVDHEDFTGQTDAVEMIEIRSRVTGYLDKVLFEHGAEVDANQILFEVDPRSYQAELERADAMIAQSEARLKRLRADYRRSETLLPTGGITRQQFDLVSADLADAEAVLKSSRASRDLAELNLSYTKIKAPIRGRVSEPFIDEGNLVKGDDTILTRIVTQDPMFVYFDIDERTMLQLRRRDRARSAETGGGRKSGGDTDKLTIYMQLADEEDFPHQGQLDFEENRVDSGTGTLRVRGVFDNHQRLLSPGLFVRVRLPIGEPHQAIVIPERAIGTDQGQKFVYVVGADGKAEYRRLKVGRLQHGMREVKEGLTPEDRIVVSGLQRVRPGADVEAKLVDATATSNPTPPTPAPKEEADTKSNEKKPPSTKGKSAARRK